MAKGIIHCQGITENLNTVISDPIIAIFACFITFAR